jgi:hypothetical protein
MLPAGIFMVALAVATAVGFLWLVKTVEVSPVIAEHDNRIDHNHNQNNRHTRQSSTSNRVPTSSTNTNSSGSVRRGLFDDNGRATTSNVIARDDPTIVTSSVSTQQQLAAVVSVGGTIDGTEVDGDVFEVSTTTSTVTAAPTNSNSNDNSGGSWYRNFNRQQVNHMRSIICGFSGQVSQFPGQEAHCCVKYRNFCVINVLTTMTQSDGYISMHCFAHLIITNQSEQVAAAHQQAQQHGIDLSDNSTSVTSEPLLVSGARYNDDSLNSSSNSRRVEYDSGDTSLLTRRSINN